MDFTAESGEALDQNPKEAYPTRGCKEQEDHGCEHPKYCQCTGCLDIGTEDLAIEPAYPLDAIEDTGYNQERHVYHDPCVDWEVHRAVEDPDWRVAVNLKQEGKHLIVAWGGRELGLRLGVDYGGILTCIEDAGYSPNKAATAASASSPSATRSAT